MWRRRKIRWQIFTYDDSLLSKSVCDFPSGVDKVLDVVREVELMLQREQNWVYDRAKDDICTDVQFINGGRCQILLGGQENSESFRALVEIHKNKQPEDHWMKKCRGEQIERWLTAYCKNTVHGKREGKANYQLNNFSFIISCTSCEMQAVHLDTRAPNETGFMVFSAGAAATKIFYIKGRKKLATYDDFMAYLEDIYADKIGGMYELKHLRTTNLTEVQEVEEILEGYGNCLLPCEACEEIDHSSEGLLQGSICMLGGDHLHAGPACTGFRAILFFSGNPPVGDPYNREAQFNGGTLLGEILIKLYSVVGVAGYRTVAFCFEMRYANKCYIWLTSAMKR
jgi:hypothetical protein